MSAKVMEALSFHLEDRGGVMVRVDKCGGCGPATLAEVELWNALEAADQARGEGDESAQFHKWAVEEHVKARGREAVAQEPQIIHSEAIVEANSKLCSFSTRWELDGDYMRCRICQRPQLTSYARYPFPHVDGCKGAQSYEAHPWITFVQLLTPLTQSVAKSVDLEQFRNAVDALKSQAVEMLGVFGAYPRRRKEWQEQFEEADRLLALIDAQKEVRNG